MGQNEVLKKIKSNGPMTARELAEELDLSFNTVQANLKGLVKWGLLDYEIELRKEGDCDGPNSTRVYSLTEKAKKGLG